jgi:formate dehydrogenase maturation protein FdhE
MSRKTGDVKAKVIVWFFAKAVFSLLRRNLNWEENTDRISLFDEDVTDFSRIRCPLCEWQPKSSTRWSCGNCGHPEYFYNACGTEWNTFVTRGKCPGCRHPWKWTMCLRCFGWALHGDWYQK